MAGEWGALSAKLATPRDPVPQVLGSGAGGLVLCFRWRQTIDLPNVVQTGRRRTHSEGEQKGRTCKSLHPAG
jgi:hypothetical protein